MRRHGSLDIEYLSIKLSSKDVYVVQQFLEPQREEANIDFDALSLLNKHRVAFREYMLEVRRRFVRSTALCESAIHYRQRSTHHHDHQYAIKQWRI